ncbi:MAG: universal stress protein [Planctomycetota bacterium]|nr:universal stress protein [Planctomycetota bacterium]
MKISHILLATDLSEESWRGFAYAADLAHEKGAKITLLNVVENLTVAPHGAPMAPPIGDPEGPVLKEVAQKGLEKRRKELPADIEVDCHAILGTDLGTTIADFANEHGCDLIVISTHGRSGFRRFIMGSTAEVVLRHSTVPVMVIPRVA